jgi:hypothetical protein
MRTIEPSTDWQAAAEARAAEPVQKSHIETVRREQRKLLPRTRQS